MPEVNVGAAPNDNTGDPLRTAFTKINTDITWIKENLDVIERLPDADALLAARVAAEVAQAAAEDAEDSAAASATASATSATQSAASATASATSATQSASSAANALISQNTALAAANAAGPTIIYATKAAADAALAGLPNGTVIEVGIDESRNGGRSRYRKTGGVYVFELALADLVRSQELAREGFGRNARNTWSTLARISDPYMGTDGVGGTDYFPRTITASQTGTTVTASAAVFRKFYVGAIIYWDSGEEAVIRAIDNQGSGWSDITTCTVDRSQTVASGPATIRAKHLVGMHDGDSVGNRIAAVVARLKWRSVGFGGIVVNANNVQDNFGAQISRVVLAGGATDDTNDAHFADYPWGQRWAIPSGGSLTIELMPEVSLGVARPLRHSLAPQEKRFDTTVIVWRRAAGAFTVQRKRRFDATWEDVETVSNALVGTGAWAFRKYTHELREDWQYRITGTSGTVYFQSIAFRNDSAPGFVLWSLSRGGRRLSDFDAISTAELEQLCQIHQQPDFRTVFAFDTRPGAIAASDYTAELATDRALWAAAAPRTDTIWFTGWEAVSDQAEQRAWNEAVIMTAIANDDPIVPLEHLFGDYATSGSLLGWTEDGVHPSIPTEVIMGHMFFKTLGVADHPTIRDGRDVSAFQGDFANLRVLGRSVPAQIKSVRNKLGEPARGVTWLSTTCRLWADDILPAALGSSDFTIHLDLTLPTTVSATNNLFVVSSNALATATAGELVVALESTHRLTLYLRNGSGVVIEYRFANFLTLYGGQRGCLTIRSDVAKGRFDIFWDGQPFNATGTTAGTGDALGTWTGTGLDVGMIQNGNIADRVTVFGAMLWASRLTDAQIIDTVEADAPATAPLFWWDFSAGVGRLVRDHSGNNRNAIFANGNPNQYNIGAGPTWLYPKQQLARAPVPLTINAATVLIPGDDIIVAMSANRDMLLPAASRVGDLIRITTNGAFTWRVTQAAGQQIRSGASATTAGTGGRLTIPNQSSVTLMCVTANTEWVVAASAGAALTFT